jgi:hypothetical protein
MKGEQQKKLPHLLTNQSQGKEEKRQVEKFPEWQKMCKQRVDSM